MFTAFPQKAVVPGVLRPKPRHCNASTPAGLLPPHVTLTLRHWLWGVWLCFGAWISVIRSLSQWICENNCQQLLSQFIIMEIQPSVLLIAFSFTLNFSLHLFAFIANATAMFLACVSSLFTAYFLFHNFSIFLWKILSMSIKSQCKSLRTFLHIIVCSTLNSHWRSFPSCQNHF